MTDARTAEYVNRLVAEAPPLSRDQHARLHELLAPMRGETSYSPIPPRRPTERELKRERLTEQAKAIAAEVQACAICGTPIFVHKRSGHPWEPNEAAISRYERNPK